MVNLKGYKIIKGKTYEQFLKKYNHDFDKWRLLSFYEHEMPYVNKRRTYWEVKDKNGNKIYCLVPLIKHKAIVSGCAAGVLLAGAIATTVVMLLPKPSPEPEPVPFTGEVTEEQWKASLENIVHINDYSKKLNYTTKSSVVLTDVRGGGKTHELKNLIVDGDYEEAEDANGTKVYMYDYHHLPLKWVDGQENIVAWNSMLHDYIGYAFGNFYDAFNDGFVFNKETKTYTYESKKGEIEGIEDVKCSVTFDTPQTIKKLSCNYSMLYGEKKEVGETFSGEFEYTYGNAKCEEWSKDVKEILDSRLINGSNSHVGFDENNNIKIANEAFENFKDGSNFIISLDTNKEGNIEIPVGLQEFRMYDSNNTIVPFWFYKVRVFNHSYELERGSDDDWQYIYNKDTKYVDGFRLNKPTTSEDEITILLSLDTTESRLKNYDYILISKASN